MIKDPKITKFVNRRLFLIFAGQFSLFGILVYRLFNLQIIKHKSYFLSAENNQSRTVIEPVPRGLILDVNNKILAENSFDYLLILDSRLVHDINIFIRKIREHIDLSEKEESRIKNFFQKKKRFIDVKSIGFDDFLSLQYSIESFPEILINRKYLRIYPFGDAAAHILGYVVNENKKYNNNYYVYSSDFKIGKIGIEEKFNDELTGENKVTTFQVDAHGRKIGEINSVNGRDGLDIKTTINIDLQKFIYDETFNVGSTTVVIDIENHSLVSMVSSPSFNPEILNNDELRKVHWASLATNPDKPLINKAISGLYSPGSTFKIVVALAALELGIINENSTVFCNGGYQVGNRFYHCLHYHGSVNVKQAIQKSCNSFFYALAKKMDIGFLENFARSLGFGEISNLNLQGESRGIVPSKLWKLKKFANLWYIGDSANLMIGQGYLSCSALQLCSAVASIASGEIMRLTLLNKDDENKKFEKNKLISEKNFKIVKQGMFDVINSQGGTGYYSIGSKYKDLKICGKTGTVQVSSGKKDKNHSVFVGFAPFDKPKYAVSVIGEYLGFGASFAAPLAGKIFNFLKYN